MSGRSVDRIDPDNLPAVLKVKELSQLLRIPLTRTYELIERGEIPCVRLGRSIRIPRSVVVRLLGVEGPTETN